MVRLTRRSDANRGNMKNYSLVDAKIDHPHLPLRELPYVVRQVALDRGYKHEPLRSKLAK